MTSRSVFQFVSREDGGRSDPIVTSDKDMAEHIPKFVPEEDYDRFMVLKVCDVTIKDGQERVDISNVPLITVRRFLSMFDSGVNGHG